MLDVKAWQEKVRADNEAFLAASPEEKRVMIARDVIAGIEARRTTPLIENIYMERTGAEDNGAPFVPVEACEVCAIGAMWVATIDRFGRASNRGVLNGEEYAMAGLAEFFSDGQIYRIEAEFERYLPGMVKSSRWGYEGADRLKAIMQNIIDNSGTFVPFE